MKNWIMYENDRNKRFAALYTEMIKRAIGAEHTCSTFMGHHLSFELDNDLGTENEFPSADCLMFDHEIMGRIFGDDAKKVMMHLSQANVEDRDTILKQFFDALPGA